MSSKQVILDMLSELDQHKCTDRYQLLSNYVQMRLDKSLETYYKEILSSYRILSHQKEEKVLKQLTKKK